MSRWDDRTDRQERLQRAGDRHDERWERERMRRRYGPAMRRWTGEGFDQRYPDPRWDGEQYGLDPRTEGQRHWMEDHSRFDPDRARMRRGPYAGRGPKNWAVSDERLRDMVSERMAHHSHLDASDIEVDVSDCEVTLRGTVDNRLQKRLADDIADRVPGVRDVHNHLTLRRETETERQHQAPVEPAKTRTG